MTEQFNGFNFNRTALHICVLAEDETLLNLLLENAKLNLECKNENGHTALWLALKSSKKAYQHDGGDAMAEILVKAGASTSAVSIYTLHSNNIIK
jgi:ankyrin repeat protein